MKIQIGQTEFTPPFTFSEAYGLVMDARHEDVCELNRLSYDEVEKEAIGNYIAEALNSNGRDAYDGDRVVVGGEILTVEWNDDFHGWQFSNGHSFQQEYGVSLLVIGNIYEIREKG